MTLLLINLLINKWLYKNVVEAKRNIYFDKTNIALGAVACTCKPITLETEFGNGVGSVLVGGRWLGFVITSNPAQKEEPA